MKELNTLSRAVPTAEKPRLHKQSRSYLKTSAKLVGKDMQEQSLFTLPTYDNDIRRFKDVLSKNTAILGNLLFTLWQANKDTEGYYKITNLSHIAGLMQTIPQELKLYFICLGGYQYPIVKISIDDKGKRILSTYTDKLFYVKFNIRLKDNEKETDFTNDDRVGNNWVNFIKNRDIESIDIAPSQSFIEDMQGKGLGNVLVDNSLVAYCLGLSELAYKIFCFSSSNKPSFKIGFDKLISNKYLNLEKQVYGVYKDEKRVSAGQGKKKVLKRIKYAFDELKTTGHLTKWGYDEANDEFNWTYSDKIIKHKDLLPKELTPAINTERQTINTERQTIDTERQEKK